MSSESNLTNPLIAYSEKSAEIVANVGNSLVAINRQRFSCSGIYWRDGLIVTSEESLRRIKDITVTLPDGETTPVTLLGRDPSTDTAVLKTEASLPIAQQFQIQKSRKSWLSD